MIGIKELKAFLKVLSEVPELKARYQHQAEILLKNLQDNGKLGRSEITIFLELMGTYLRLLRKA